MEPKTHKVRILLQAFLNLPGLPPGKQKKIFQEKRTLKPLIPRREFEGETDPIIMPETDAQDEGGYLQNLTLYTSQSGASTVG